MRQGTIMYIHTYFYKHLTQRQRVRKVKTKGFTKINQQCSEESFHFKSPSKSRPLKQCAGSVVYKLPNGPFSLV